MSGLKVEDIEENFWQLQKMQEESNEVWNTRADLLEEQFVDLRVRFKRLHMEMSNMMDMFKAWLESK